MDRPVRRVPVAAPRRPGFPARTALARALLLGLATHAPLGWGFVVGEPVLGSGLSEPLLVSVPVLAADSAEIARASLIEASLLPRAEYERRGLPPPPLDPEAVSLQVAGSPDAYEVLLSSLQLVREPVGTLLLEIRVGNTRVLRELSLIFELPDLGPAPSRAPRARPARATTPAPVAAPTGVGSAPATGDLATPADRPAPVAAARPAPTAPPARNRTSRRTPLLRFQLDGGFHSYRALASEGRAPAPLGSRTITPDTTARPALTVAPAPAPAALTGRPQVPDQPGPSPRQAALRPGVDSARSAWTPPPPWLLALGALCLALLAGLARRRPTVPSPSSVLAVPDAPPAAEPAASRAGPAMSTPAAASAAAATIQPPSWAPEQAYDIRRRGHALLAGTTHAGLQRKHQILEAYLDLGRLDSARALLDQLEHELQSARQPRVGMKLVKG